MDPERTKQVPEFPPPRCCPICGQTFDEYAPTVTCTTPHYGQQEFSWDELIHEDADYLWME